MTDVFISYKRKERQKARILAEALARSGMEVWWDVDLLPGDRFQDEINVVLDKARVVVVLWTPEALESVWVRGEAMHALTRDVYVPAQLEHTIIPVPFNTFHVTDLSHWRGAPDDPAIAELVEGVLKRVGPKSVAQSVKSDAEVENVLNEPSIEVEYWRAVSTHEQPSKKEYQSYLDRFGDDGSFAELANLRIEEMTTNPHSEDNAAVLRVFRNRLLNAHTQEEREALLNDVRAYSDRKPSVEGDALRNKVQSELDVERSGFPIPNIQLDTVADNGESKSSPVAMSNNKQEHGIIELVLIAPLLALLAVTYSIGSITANFTYFVVPVAAWIGQRYNKSGLKVLSVALIPMLFFSTHLGGFVYGGESALYLTAITVCWACAYPKQWWSKVLAIEYVITTAVFVVLLILSYSNLYFAGAFGYIGWTSNGTLLLLLVFTLGIIGKRSSSVLAMALFLAALGFTILLRLATNPEELNDYRGIIRLFEIQLTTELNFSVAFKYLSIRDIYEVIAVYVLGRVTGHALGRHAILDGMTVKFSYSAFLLLWLLSAVWITLNFTATGRVYFTGSNNVIWLLAFTSGIVWPSKALSMVSLACIATLFGALIIDPYFFSLWDSTAISIWMPHWSVLTCVCVVSLLMCLFGGRVRRYACVPT